MKQKTKNQTVSVETASKMLGHKNQKTIQEYLSVMQKIETQKLKN